MHKRHNPSNNNTLTTSGAVLHQAGGYDLPSRLMGMGVDGSNSRMLVEMAGIRAGDRVLDVGCGTGSLTLTAAKVAGASGAACGVDASQEMIAAARKKALASGIQAAFEMGLIERLPYPEASFDVVINRLVIHHLPGDLKLKGFTEILRVLKPGGRLFIADFKPPANPLLAHLVLALVGHGMMQSDVSGIPAMLQAVGFSNVVSGPTRSALLAFVSGKKPSV